MKVKVITEENKIDEILSTGVEDIFVKEHLKKELMSGKMLRVKFGIDPTGPKIHLGRAIPLRKLRDFQNLGHKAVLIVGDFTATIGDPSDKLEKRPMLTAEKIKENMKDYKKQIGKIIDIKQAEFVYNSKWLKKLSLMEISMLAESFSLQQMSKRRNFHERIEKNEEISLRELFYPLMQGYDSVAVKSDIEIGGFDQLFNVKAGRIIQKHYGMKEQDIITLKMLEGTDGRKMSTSWGNVITITDEPNDMYGKVMSLKDDLIVKYFELCTDLSKKEIPNLDDPKSAKMKLAYEIVKIYHGEKEAKGAQEDWQTKFEKGGVPEDVLEITGEGEMLEILVKNKIIDSKSAGRRLFEAGAITDMTDDKKLNIKDVAIVGHVYKIGKHKFIKIK